MKFSILVLNYNGKHLLKECVDSIYEQTFTDYELLIIDNHSSDDSVTYIKENFPKATLIENAENFGFAKGNNIGIEKSSGEWIFFLNNDASLEKNCLSVLAEFIKNRKPEQLVFAPLMLKNHAQDFVDSAGDILYPWGYAYIYENVPASDFTEDREVASVCCGAAVFNRDLLQSLHGFDEDFFLYNEDVDLSLRAKRSGAKIWLVSKAKVFHKGSATMGKRTRLHLYYLDRNRFWTKLKNFPLITLIKYAPHSFVYSMLSFALWTSRGLFLTWLKARFAMLIGVPKMLKKRREIFSKSKISTAEFESWLLKESFFRWIKSKR